MNSLVLLDPDGAPFDRGQVKQALESLPGAYNFRMGEFIGSVMESEFDFGGASTIIRFGADLESIEVTGVNDASLQAVLSLRRVLKRPLRLFDLAYSFDVILDRELSLDDLRAVIAED